MIPEIDWSKNSIIPDTVPLTCDINQFSNGVAASQRTKLSCSGDISDPSTKTRDRPEPHPVVHRGGGGQSSSGGGGGGDWFSVQSDCCLLSVERPPGSLGGGFSPVLVRFNLVESEAVVEILVVILTKRGDRR